jgi:hypothetical protein
VNEQRGRSDRGAGTNQRPGATQLENMLRKITLALIAAASLTVVAVAPASAGAPPATGTKMPLGFTTAAIVMVLLNTGVSDCLQQQWGQTGRGCRQLRTVNVCTYRSSAEPRQRKALTALAIGGLSSEFAMSLNRPGFRKQVVLLRYENSIKTSIAPASSS